MYCDITAERAVVTKSVVTIRREQGKLKRAKGIARCNVQRRER
jgi:hypothetical protein